jgi:hypothetical protein
VLGQTADVALFGEGGGLVFGAKIVLQQAVFEIDKGRSAPYLHAIAHR